jgi:putative PIN family toxin of toxin-antitoxin system
VRIVLDTNVLLVSIGRKSRHNWIFQALLDERFTLLVSTDILLEYEELISRRTRPEIAADVLKTLLSLPNHLHVEAYFHWNLITEDPTDNKFADVAFAGRAEYIITEDSHFNVLRDVSFPSISIKTIQEFAGLLK